MGMFEQLSKRERRTVKANFTDIRLAQGKTLMSQGDIGCEFIYLADGIGRIEVDGETVATVNPGDFFGELALFRRRFGLDPLRVASVHVDGPSQIYVATMREFAAVLDDAPTVREKVVAQALRLGMPSPV